MITSLAHQILVVLLQITVPRVRSTVSNLGKKGSRTSHRDTENIKTDRCFTQSIGLHSSLTRHISRPAAQGLQ